MSKQAKKRILGEIQGIALKLLTKKEQKLTMIIILKIFFTRHRF